MSGKVIVTVSEGKVRGIKKTSEFSGAEYYSFFGVPYGGPTAKHNRFKNPVPVKPWSNILDGTSEREGCSHFSLLMKRFCGSEDCLYSNIHTPKLPTLDEPLKPVIVNIHPGGFFHGSPETYYYGSPDYVMHHDIVYVGVAFRLQVLGSLKLDMETCSGNQALKDIILSLQWMKKNISYFGGDPNNITLIGSSSGAITIHHLMLSPAANGLFHKGVIMGGNAFNPTAHVQEENAQLAFELARAIGYQGTDPSDKRQLLKFLKNVTAAQLVLIRPEKKLHEGFLTVIPSSPFVPLVDFGENAVLPLSHRQLIPSIAKIPLIFGICDKEAAMGFSRGLRKTTMEKYFTSYRQNAFGWGCNINDDQVNLIKKEIESFYFNGGVMEDASLSRQIDVQTDIIYSDIYDTLIDAVSSNPSSSVYVYKFDFEGNACSMKDALQLLIEDDLDGTFHASDYSYWTCIKDHWGIKNGMASASTTAMIETFTKLITTFARTGNPNHQNMDVLWRPSTPQKPCYLSINDQSRMIDGKLNNERMLFWENIRKRFAKE